MIFLDNGNNTHAHMHECTHMWSACTAEGD